MYKVLIIDDEPIIRKGLKNIIKWHEYNCKVVGEACDGVEGIEKVKTLDPDIIFTDIKMPELNGIEMIRALNDYDKQFRIIILSGFNDFDLVREALVLGAFDYLLKPTKLDEITKVVERAVKELNVIKNSREVIDVLKEKFEKYMPQLREKLMYEMMLGITTDPNEISERAKNLNICIDDFYTVLAYSIDSEQKNGKKQYGIIHTFEDMLRYEYRIMWVAIDDCSSVFVICIDEGQDGEGVFSRCRELQDMMKSSLNMNIGLAFSERGHGLDDVLICYEQSRRAMEYSVYSNVNDFSLYSDIPAFGLNSAAVRVKRLGELLLEGVDSSSMSMVSDYIEAIRVVLYTGAKGLDEDIKKVLIEIADKIRLKAGHDEATVNYFDNEQILEDIKILSESAVKNNFDNSNQDIKLIVKKSLEYLEKNYMNQITLAQLADNVFVSQYYISRMFKRETGKTMTENLNGIRIKKACSLLDNVEYKVYQVGEMVGIPDSHYFSKLFKHIVGVNPSMYRNNILNNSSN